MEGNLNTPEKAEPSWLDMFLLERFNYPKCVETFSEKEMEYYLENKDKDIVFTLHMIKTLKGFEYPSLID